MSICKKTLCVSALFFSQICAHQYVALPHPEFGQKEVVSMAPTPKKKEEPKSQAMDNPQPLGGDANLEMLIWALRTSDSAYAIESSANRFNTTPNNSTVRSVDFDFTLGFRLGAGCDVDHDGWHLHSNYTYYRPSASASKSTSLPSLIDLPYGLTQAMSQAITADIWLNKLDILKAVSYYDFKYQTLDLYLKRTYEVGKINFTPKIGLEAGWFNSDQRSQYTGGSYLGDNLLILQLKDRFWGIGPKTSLAMDWNLGRGFSLIQALDLSLLLGQLKLTYNERYTPAPTTTTSLVYRATQFVPHLAAFMGLGYTYNFDSTIQSLILKGGFEGHYLWNYIQDVYNGQVVQDGNLYTYGATISAALTF